MPSFLAFYIVFPQMYIPHFRKRKEISLTYLQGFSNIIILMKVTKS